MFAALIIISGFTAAITTALTVNQLTSSIQGPARSARRLGRHPAGFYERSVPPPPSYCASGLRDGERRPAGNRAGEVDAMPYDAPLLCHVAATALQHTVEVLPATFERQDYGFALPAGSPLREPINRVLLEKIKLPEWRDTLRRYLGS